MSTRRLCLVDSGPGARDILFDVDSKNGHSRLDTDVRVRRPNVSSLRDQSLEGTHDELLLHSQSDSSTLAALPHRAGRPLAPLANPTNRP